MDSTSDFEHNTKHEPQKPEADYDIKFIVRRVANGYVMEAEKEGINLTRREEDLGDFVAYDIERLIEVVKDVLREQFEGGWHD